MSEYKLEGPALKKTIMFARRGPISFAYNPGKQTADDLFSLHRKKSPLALRTDARKSGEGSKAACGLATLSGKLLTLQCEGTPLPSMAKKLKKYFKTQKLMLNIRIMDESGAVVESEIEDLPDDPSMDEQPDDAMLADDDDGDDAIADAGDGAAEPGDEPDVASDEHQEPAAPEPVAEEPVAEEPVADDPKQLAARLMALRDRMTGLAAADVAGLTPDFKQAVTALKAGDLTGAAAGADRIEARIDALANPAQDAPAADAPAADAPAADAKVDTSALQAQSARLRMQAEQLPEQHNLRPKILSALDQADTRIKDLELPQAEIILAKVAEALTAAAMGAGKEKQPANQDDWEKAHARLAPLVQQAVAENLVADVDKLEKAWVAIVDLAEDKDDYTKAIAGLAKIEAMLERVGLTVPQQDDTPVDPELAAWQDAVAALEPDFTQAVSQGLVQDPDKLRMAWGVAMETAQKGDYAKAHQILDRIGARVAAGMPDGTTAHDKGAAANVQGLAAGRLKWVQTRSTMQTELGKLQAAILTAIADDPDLVDIATEVPSLSDRLDDFDSRLDDALDAIVNAKDDGDRKALHQKAVRISKDYRTVLSSDFFADVDQNNGFVAVRIYAAADQALAEIESLLAA